MMWFFQLWETLNRASQRIMLWAYRKLHPPATMQGSYVAMAALSPELEEFYREEREEHGDALRILRWGRLQEHIARGCSSCVELGSGCPIAAKLRGRWLDPPKPPQVRDPRDHDPETDSYA